MHVRFAALLLLILAFYSAPAFGQRGPLIVHSWAYQLQKIDIEKIATNPTFDLIVMDYSHDGSRDRKFLPTEIARIQQTGKKALAYISIGEAENYRSYWRAEWSTNPPAWLGPENPKYLGNFKVRFWDPAWQQLVLDYIGDIYAQGLDGIYCDIIDAYYYWQTEHPEMPNADALMMQFISKIRSYSATLGNRPFYIVPQNGESILHEVNITDSLRAGFFNDVDAIGVEDVFFRGSGDINNPYDPEIARFPNLQEFVAHQKTVLSIEYLTQKPLIDAYIPQARAKHFIPYCTVRLLDTLIDGISPLSEVALLPSSAKLSVHYSINGSAYIDFIPHRTEHAVLYLTDLLGRTSAPLFEGEVVANQRYQIPCDTKLVGHGMYMVRLQSASRQEITKMLVD
jgi:cysteinyl-tRNA synthetase